MITIATPAAMTAWTDQARHAGRRVALVPTMGALHAGHLHLMSLARSHGDIVVASIFVNPLQFNRRDDFDTYPRPLEDDLAACASVGVDAVYAPTAGAMYPEGFQTHVEPGSLADPMEGTMRPGHFRGVTTVVAKLLNAVRPDVALFGQKDYQQLAVIAQMNRDLDFGIEIVSVPTVREPDGLALSSRNRRLSAADRAAAVVVPRCLGAAVAAYRQGERRGVLLESTAAALIAAEPRARLEYVEVFDAITLERLEVVDRAAVIATAVWFDDVRLIDNELLTP
jgi:pantoate--beta-alanine ligase